MAAEPVPGVEPPATYRSGGALEALLREEDRRLLDIMRTARLRIQVPPLSAVLEAVRAC